VRSERKRTGCNFLFKSNQIAPGSTIHFLKILVLGKEKTKKKLGCKKNYQNLAPIFQKTKKIHKMTCVKNLKKYVIFYVQLACLCFPNVTCKSSATESLPTKVPGVILFFFGARSGD
jgi:hypothetical protein